MRKTLLLATILLLGLMGAAQAQLARIELLAQPEPAAREGGKNEKAGDVWLDIDLSGELAGEDGAVESFTLTYSSPLASGLMVEDGGIDLTGAEDETVDGPGSRRRNDQDHTWIKYWPTSSHSD